VNAGIWNFCPQRWITKALAVFLFLAYNKNIDTKIALFKNKQIRKTVHNNEWWFVIVDVITALTDSVQPEGYIKDMRLRDEELSQGWGQIATPLFFQTGGGRQRLNCANAEGVFRIVQSIPSPKAEPFKRWLAKVGYERVREIEDPELATKRTRVLYKLKGYPEDWIEKSTPRLRRAFGVTIFHFPPLILNPIEKLLLYRSVRKQFPNLGPDDSKTKAG
jgi:hypothetical protein